MRWRIFFDEISRGDIGKKITELPKNYNIHKTLVKVFGNRTPAPSGHITGVRIQQGRISAVGYSDGAVAGEIAGHYSGNGIHCLVRRPLPRD